MAELGEIRVEVSIKDMKKARLLILELTQLEKDLDHAKEYDFARRVGHAIKRFTDGDIDSPDAPENP